jgi:predicted DNA-binding protein YlxM (UPF0122 family)
MPDNRNNRGGRDRQRVAAGEDYEVRHVAEKFNVSTQQVTGAIRATGGNRKDVEAYLKQKARQK